MITTYIVATSWDGTTILKAATTEQVMEVAKEWLRENADNGGRVVGVFEGVMRKDLSKQLQDFLVAYKHAPLADPNV